ncbi:Peptidase M10A, stromelysin-type [Parasponia andersonii]|uniref:Peptidase M10A, stromelysin-type n=1 Tax=Parasponia andersonii TaxID=3476 RepID=A0A2P5CFG3_PARAD|nr:Peptidase M10A, stromelysin-type [Parasponia andersonii]
MAPKIQLLGAILLLLVMHSIDTTESKHDAFEFIEHLKGCHKGQNVSGVHQLKQYLKTFGYLNYNAVKHHNHINHANDDVYDDALESAVKSYQQQYHLKVTGTLDPETVKEMTMPRCGVPDITNKTHHHGHHNRKLIHAVSHYQFFRGNPRWRKSQLTYRFRSSVSVPGTANIRSICARAFQKWAQVSHFTFQEVHPNAAADIEIGFHSGDHGDGANFDGPGGTLAHAFAPTVGYFHFDAQEFWSENPGPDQVDLESVAVYEIGHLLGLGHDDTVPDAIMYSKFSYGTTKRNLHADDIRGIRALYGLNK